MVTWPLWQTRAHPQLLPVVEIPMPFGFALLASLALAACRPVVGSVLHVVLLALAILADQTREQPQVLSMGVLLLATLPIRGAREIGSLHLCSLWLWSGIGKLTSARFWENGGSWLLGDGSDAGTTTLGVIVAVLIGLGELTLAVLALLPRTRRTAGLLGAIMHLSILTFLSPLGRDWNPSVWAWNAVLAVASLQLLRRTDAGLGAILSRGGPVVRIAAGLFVALPIGFHLGVVDAPFAMQVYTQNGCRALVVRANGPVEVVGDLPDLRVHLPPVPRINLVWFARHGRLGDRMILVEDRPLALFATPERTVAFEDVR